MALFIISQDRQTQVLAAIFDCILQCNFIRVLFVIRTKIIDTLISLLCSVFVPIPFGVAASGPWFLRALYLIVRRHFEIGNPCILLAAGSICSSRFKISRVTWGSPAPLREKLILVVSITCRCIIVQ